MIYSAIAHGRYTQMGQPAQKCWVQILPIIMTIVLKIPPKQLKDLGFTADDLKKMQLLTVYLRFGWSDENRQKLTALSKAFRA